MTIIFQKKYDSESIVDAFRDLSEVLDPAFNDLLDKVEINENTIFNLIFSYKEAGKNIVSLLNKKYGEENSVDMEDDVHNALGEYPFEQDEYGFFDGDLMIEIVVK